MNRQRNRMLNTLPFAAGLMMIGMVATAEDDGGDTVLVCEGEGGNARCHVIRGAEATDSNSVAVSLATVDWMKAVVLSMQRQGSLERLPEACQERGAIPLEAIEGIGLSPEGMLGIVVDQFPECRPDESNLPQKPDGGDYPYEEQAPDYSVVCSEEGGGEYFCETLRELEPKDGCDPKVCYPREWDTGRINHWDFVAEDCDGELCGFWIEPMDPYINNPDKEIMEAELDCRHAEQICESLQITLNFDKADLISQDAPDGSCDGVDDNSGDAGETCIDENSGTHCVEDDSGSSCVTDNGDTTYDVWWVSDEAGGHPDASRDNADDIAKGLTGDKAAVCIHDSDPDSYKCQ